MKDKYDYVEPQEKRLNMYAFPGRQMALIGNAEIEVATQGLTKREYFAAMAMQTMIQIKGENTFNLSRNTEGVTDDIASAAIRVADELLKQLK